MKRVVTALILFPLITYVVVWSPLWTVYAVTALVALLCFYEYSGIAAAYVSEPRTSISEPRTSISEPRTSISEPRTSISEPRTSISEPRTSISEPRTSISEPRTSISEPRTSISEPRTSISEPRTSVSGLGALGPLGYGAGLLILALPGDAHALLTVVAVALIALSLALRADDLRAGILRAAFLLIGVVYIFGCWRFAPLLAAPNRYWLLYALVLNWIGDIGAYYVGRAVGRHKLAPIVSPGKSWEGSAASLAASLIFGFFFLRWAIPAVPPGVALALTAAANVAGQFGDLCESALKRGAGVKDSGTLLPGHGGWLDRVDSTLFTLPVVYCVAQALGLPR